MEKLKPECPHMSGQSSSEVIACLLTIFQWVTSWIIGLFFSFYLCVNCPSFFTAGFHKRESSAQDKLKQIHF